MKIASVTFFTEKEKGGGRTPAFAFNEYADLFNIECDVVEIHSHSDIEKLNKYDAIFFATPPRISNSCFKKISKPYALMIHDETDLDKYPTFRDMVAHKNCKCLVTIDHDGDYYKKFHKKRIFWHPCCSPLYLSTFKFASKDVNKILYAGRIVDWKNPQLFLDFCRKSYNTWGMFGKEYGNVQLEYDGAISQYDNMEQFAGQYDLFWDVCGTKDNKMLVKRVNLTAFEALANGMMPIVNKNAIPEALRGCFIETDPLNFDADELHKKIIEYRMNKEERFKKTIESLKISYASYQNVKKQVSKIFECLIEANIQKKDNSVSTLLREAADLFEKKNIEYGNAYKDHPRIMHMLLGEITLKTPEDYSRYTRISSIVAKLNRYAKNWPNGHEDSAADLIVFAGMLKEFHNGEEK